MSKQKQSAIDLQENDQQTIEVRRLIHRGPSYKQIHQPDKEVNNGPSMTIPDMSLSVSEMLSRAARNLPISSGAQPIYNGEKLLPNWKNMDLIDRQEAIKHAYKLVEERKRRHNEQIAKYDAAVAAAKAEKKGNERGEENTEGEAKAGA